MRSLVFLIVALATHGASAADPPARLPNVWFGPAPASPDLIRLFTEPASWAKARAQTGAFLFSPSAVDQPQPGQPNSLDDLNKAGAFRQLKSWGIDAAIEAPAVKEFDCTARKSAEITERMIGNVVAGGGTVKILSLDESLVSGFGRNRLICQLTMAEIAANMAVYAGLLTQSPMVRSQGMPLLADIEPYPSFGVAELEQWINALDAENFQPAWTDARCRSERRRGIAATAVASCPRPERAAAVSQG